MVSVAYVAHKKAPVFIDCWLTEKKTDMKKEMKNQGQTISSYIKIFFTNFIYSAVI